MYSQFQFYTQINCKGVDPLISETDCKLYMDRLYILNYASLIVCCEGKAYSYEMVLEFN